MKLLLLIIFIFCVSITIVEGKFHVTTNRVEVIYPKVAEVVENGEAFDVTFKEDFSRAAWQAWLLDMDGKPFESVSGNVCDDGKKSPGTSGYVLIMLHQALGTKSCELSPGTYTTVPEFETTIYIEDPCISAWSYITIKIKLFDPATGQDAVDLYLRYFNV